MNVEIGAEAALFPEKEYISGIFVAVRVAGFVSCEGLSLSLWLLHIQYSNLLGFFIYDFAPNPISKIPQSFLTVQDER